MEQDFKGESDYWMYIPECFEQTHKLNLHRQDLNAEEDIGISGGAKIMTAW